MDSIGKALTFYLKYFQEMEALYVDKNRELINGINNGDRILQLVEKIGKLADKQAADFLLNAAEGITKIVNSACSTKIVRRRSSHEDNWRIDTWFWPKNRKFGKKNKTRQFCIGFDELAGKPILYTSIWVKGGLSEEERIADILGEVVQFKSKDLKWNPGNLLLGINEIHINGKAPDKQKLIEDVMEHIAKIPRSIYRQIF